MEHNGTNGAYVEALALISEGVWALMLAMGGSVMKVVNWCQRNPLLTALIFSVTLNMALIAWAISSSKKAAYAEYQSFVMQERLDSAMMKSFKYERY